MSQLIFKSLAYTNIEALLTCFNKSFENYYVPLQLTKEQLADKIYVEAIDMKLSYGAFDDDRLAAFILHGIDTIDNRKVAYNAGTGVLPAYRGRQLSYSLYEYTLEQLRNNNIEKTVLEVIDQNIAAIKTYERTGFTNKRTLKSYKGKPVIKNTISEIKLFATPDWKLVEEMCEWRRSWQYNDQTLKRGWHNYTMLTSGSGDTPRAYCIVNFKNGRIASFGTKEKDSTHLTSLFEHLGQAIENPLMIINIDEKAGSANSFVTSMGLELFITQYEMERDL